MKLIIRKYINEAAIQFKCCQLICLPSETRMRHENCNFAYHLMCLLNMNLTPREIWILNVTEQKYHVSGCGENDNGEFINLLLICS